MQYDKKEFNDQRIDTNPWWQVLLVTLLMAGITVGWYLVFPKTWPYQMWIAWVLFSIPAGITLIVPFFYVLRKIQRKRGTGPFKEN